MNVLVTGGAGYIGSHTCKALALAGLKPVAYDNLSRGHADSVMWGPLIQGELTDTKKLEETLLTHKIEAVLHFAAFAYVGESNERPTEYYENNVSGSISLLRAMQATNTKKLVFSSSCAVYGIVPVTH